jgi:hypothetical protein
VKKGIHIVNGRTPSGRITTEIVIAGRRYLQHFQIIEKRTSESSTSLN